MFKILNRNREVVGLITSPLNPVIDDNLVGMNELRFSVPASQEGLELEGYIRIENEHEYVIKEISTHGHNREVIAIMNVEELIGKVWTTFRSIDMYPTDCIREIVAGTGWTVVDNCPPNKRRNLYGTQISSWDLIFLACDVWNIEVKFDTHNKVITTQEKGGTDRGTYFMSDLNLKQLMHDSHTHKLITRVIPIGKDGLTIESVNGGKNYISNHSYSNKVITGIWQSDRYTKAEDLKEDATKYLEEMCIPYESYECKVSDLYRLEGNPNFEFNVGDVIYLIDNITKKKIQQRIIKHTKNLTSPDKDTINLANKSMSFTDYYKRLQLISNMTEQAIGSDGLISSGSIESVDADKIVGEIKANSLDVNTIISEHIKAEQVLAGHIKADQIYGEHIVSDEIDTRHLKANSIQSDHISAGQISAGHIQSGAIQSGHIDVGSVNAGHIQSGTIESNHIQAGAISSGHLQSGSIDAGHIKAGVIESSHLASQSITSSHLQSNSINSNHIQAGTIQAGHIQTGSITAGSGIIAEGAVGSAQISSLDANKINAGEIDTSKVKIKGENGFLFIENNTLYVVDNNRKIRCELGVIENYSKSNTNYGFVVRGADGQTIMLDHRGVHNAGITDGAIDNRKVSENANISGKKLDIDSVIRTINEDGSVTIQGTRVQIGNTTLDVKLSEQNNLITEHTQRLNTQQAEITANTNAIKLKVDSQTYTQDKQAQQSTLNKHSSSISVLEKQIVSKVENVDIQNALDEYGNVVDSKILEKTSKLEQTDDSIRLSVAENKEKLSETTNYIVNSQALFSIEGFESIGGSIERYVYPKTSIVEIPIPEPPEQEETPPVDIPTETPITPPTVEDNTNTQPPTTDIPSTPPIPTTNSTKIHFINTGHTGDCILIQTDNGKSILVDSNYRQNAEVVVDYLKGVGVTSLDYMIATHFHTDHAEGFPYIMDNIKVKGAKAYYRLPDFSKLPSKEVGWKTAECWESFRVKCNAKGVVRYENLTEKQRITLSDTSYLEFYNTQFANYSDYNSMSLVVLFAHGNKKYLLTGDINPTAQAQLVGKIGKVDMAKVPHHGYNSTISEAWVKELNPRCWVTTRTYGWENAYRDVGMLQVLGYPNYVQYTSGGHIVLTSTGNDFTLSTSTKFLFGSCWCKYNNDDKLWYWFKQGGTIAKNETVIIQGKKYRFNNNGVCINPYNPE